MAISDAVLTHLLNLYRKKIDMDEENVMGIEFKDITAESGEDCVIIVLQNCPDTSYCGIFCTSVTPTSAQLNNLDQLAM